jgi:hypothetical protein
MRLDEIISENLLIIKLRKMKIKFDIDFSLIEDAHTVLSTSRSAARHRLLLGDIEILENTIKSFLDYDFDPDIDIDQLKIEANNIITELDKIKKQIP